MSSPTTLRARHYRTGRGVEFRLQSGRVIAWQPTTRRTDLLFGPGFFDLQCNGFAGVDFNHPATSAEQVAAAVCRLWQHGCTHVLPTVITHEPARLEQALRTLEAARTIADVRPSIPGYHLEGPFISPVEGARGAHPWAFIIPVQARLWQRLQRAAGGRIALLTLAPEVRGALGFIGQLRAEAVIPSLGHTMASYEVITQAAAAGALLSTHLGNGCPQLLPRHANPILAQLGCDALAASLIPDGIHLPPEVLRSFLRAKEAARVLIVTDAMAAAGAPPGCYTLGDLTMEVGADGVARQPGSPNLAGSSLTVDRAVWNLATMADIPLAEAWAAASERPWALWRKGGRPPLAPHARGVVILRPLSTGLQVQATLLGRRVLWERTGA